MKNKIIATGLTGLVGSRINELLSPKYTFFNFSLENNIDITDINLLEKEFNKFPDTKIVLHLAAFTDVDAAFKQNGDKNGSCYRVNVIGSKNISQLCKKYHKYLIHISTDFVFDGNNPPADGYTENNRPHPIEWYGKTKYWAENEVINSGCQSAILRIAFPFKAKPSPKKIEPQVKLDLVRKIIQKLKNKEIMNMFTDQMMTPLFIDDFVKVMDKCFKDRPTGIFHATGSTALSAYELTIKVAKVFNLDHSQVNKFTLDEFMRQNPNSRPRPKNTSLSNKKIEKELRIQMSTIDEALQKMKEQVNYS